MIYGITEAMDSELVAFAPPGARGVLPYMTLTGTCGQIGYGFQGIFLLNGVWISSLFVLNRVSLHFNGKGIHFNLWRHKKPSFYQFYFLGADLSLRLGFGRPSRTSLPKHLLSTSHGPSRCHCGALLTELAKLVCWERSIVSWNTPYSG